MSSGLSRSLGDYGEQSDSRHTCVFITFIFGEGCQLMESLLKRYGFVLIFFLELNTQIYLETGLQANTCDEKR